MSYIKNLTDPSAMAALLTNISRNQKTKSDLIERLSSGVVIHSGGSLALSQSLNADKKLASVAIQNINEGISLIQIRDDGIEAVHGVLQKQKELASMAASGALDNSQRSVYDQEFQELTTLMQNITSDTKYNDINLLSEAKEIRLQAGLEGQSALSNNPNQLLIGTDNFYEDSIEGRGLATQDEAQSTLAIVEQAILDVENRAGSIKGKNSVLDIAVSNMTSMRNELGLAVDRITSVDVAQNVAELTAAQIIENQQMALFAQANQQAPKVLELLGGSLKINKDSLIS